MANKKSRKGALRNAPKKKRPAKKAAKKATTKKASKKDLKKKTVVDGVPKRQRRGSVAAVQFGGAPMSVSGSREDGGFSLYLLQLHREVQECDPTWSFGKRFVGWC